MCSVNWRRLEECKPGVSVFCTMPTKGVLKIYNIFHQEYIHFVPPYINLIFFIIVHVKHQRNVMTHDSVCCCI